MGGVRLGAVGGVGLRGAADHRPHDHRQVLVLSGRHLHRLHYPQPPRGLGVPQVSVRLFVSVYMSHGGEVESRSDSNSL